MKHILNKALPIVIFLLFLWILDEVVAHLELTPCAFLRSFNVPIFFLLQKLVYRLLRMTDVPGDGFIVLIGFIIAVAFPYVGLALELFWTLVGAVLTYAGARLYARRKKQVK